VDDIDEKRKQALRSVVDALRSLEGLPPDLMVVVAVRGASTFKNMYVYSNEGEVYLTLGMLEQVRNDLLASLPHNAHLRSTEMLADGASDLDEVDEPGVN
jgi:hypothetical protein